MTTGPDPLALARSAVDRSAVHRLDEGWLAAAWDDPSARVLVVDGGRVLVSTDEEKPRLVLVPTAQAPSGPRAFLGRVPPVGAPMSTYWSVEAPLADVPGAGAAGLRDVGADLDDSDAGLAVHAIGLANWHAGHSHCPACGGPTRRGAGGHVRVCEADGSEHHPRTDPAVIMLVSDGDDRCVLGRQPSWPPGRYSTLAGFVETGESAEQAVVREVAEEVGLTVVDIRYTGSQPWPFPASLMLGFTARAVDGEVVLVDGELEAARWFSRAELRAEVAAGRVLMPGRLSIAHRLVTTWLDGDR